MVSPEITSLMEIFISGDDTSQDLVGQLEVLIDDEFPEDDYLQATVELLACYRPEGGEWTVDTNFVKQRLLNTKEYLARHY